MNPNHKTSYRSPENRLNTRANSGHGTNHWISQRLSAGALLGLNLWFICAVLCHGPMGYDGVRAWFQDPLSFILLSLYLGVLTYHGLMGIKVVADDYITCLSWRNGTLWGIYSIFGIGAIYGWVQLLTVYIQGLTHAS